MLDELDDGADGPLVILALERAPFLTHGTLRCVCRRLKTIVASRAFREWRVERGLAEYGLVVAGGKDSLEDSPMADCRMITSEWYAPIEDPDEPIAPDLDARIERHRAGMIDKKMTNMSVPRIYACSAIVEDEDGQPEMWVMGGRGDGWNFLATVEAYNPRTNTWRSCLPLSQFRYGAVAGVVGGRLVVAGGNGGMQRL